MNNYLNYIFGLSDKCFMHMSRRTLVRWIREIEKNTKQTEAEIRADERWKFVEWLCNKTEYTHIEVDSIGIYSDDYKMIWKPIDEVIAEYEKE